LDDVNATPTTLALEELALTLAKTSIHTAQQLIFILIAALEDYQPELSSGNKNSSSNIVRFFRCARMLKNINQMVIFRNVSVSSNVTSITNPMLLEDNETRKSGFLLYKRVYRKSRFVSKSWKRRYFSVHYRVLSCYRNVDDQEPLRSILLPGCILEFDAPDSKYHYQFSLYNKTTYLRFNLRAPDEESYNGWIEYLQR
jgi:hypothetical protein